MALARLGAAVAAVASALLLCPLSVHAIPTVFVSPTGDDGASGTSPSSPLRSLSTARDVARGVAPPGAPRRVLLEQGGYFELGETLALGAADSGTVWGSYAAAETTSTRATHVAAASLPTISAGTKLGPWSAAAGGAPSGALVAVAPAAVLASRPTQLWVGDARATRARSPNVAAGDEYSRGASPRSCWTLKPIAPCRGGTCPPADSWGFVYQAGSLSADTRDVEQVDALVYHAWTAEFHRLQRVVAANSTALFAQKAATPVGKYSWASDGRYVLFGSRDFLDAPGEWVLDATNGTVLYIPRSDAERAALLNGSLSATMPVVESLLSLNGVENTTFTDLSFSHTASGDPGTHWSYFPPSAAVMVSASRNVAFDGCRVSHGGTSGLQVGSGAANVTISSCAFTDLGGEGITMTGADATLVVINNTLVNDTGIIWMGQPAGIRLRGAADIVATHNEVAHGPYGGILVGWQAGTPAPPVTPPPPGRARFTVAFNDVHDYGLGALSDFGGVYMSSDNNTCWEAGGGTCYLPTDVYQNWIHRGRHSTGKGGYGSEGTYTDEQMAGANITHNLIEDIGAGGIYFHCGKDHTAVDNIIVGAGAEYHHGGPMVGYLKSCNAGGNPTWPQLPVGFQFSRNIVAVMPAPNGTNTTTQFTTDSDYRNASFSGELLRARHAGAAR